MKKTSKLNKTPKRKAFSWVKLGLFIGGLLLVITLLNSQSIISSFVASPTINKITEVDSSTAKTDAEAKAAKELNDAADKVERVKTPKDKAAAMANLLIAGSTYEKIVKEKTVTIAEYNNAKSEVTKDLQTGQDNYIVSDGKDGFTLNDNGASSFLLTNATPIPVAGGSSSGASCPGANSGIGSGQWAQNGYGRTSKQILPDGSNRCKEGQECPYRECMQCSSGSWGGLEICGEGDASKYVTRPDQVVEKTGLDNCWANGAWYADSTSSDGTQYCSNGQWKASKGEFLASKNKACADSVSSTDQSKGIRSTYSESQGKCISSDAPPTKAGDGETTGTSLPGSGSTGATTYTEVGTWVTDPTKCEYATTISTGNTFECVKKGTSGAQTGTYWKANPPKSLITAYKDKTACDQKKPANQKCVQMQGGGYARVDEGFKGVISYSSGVNSGLPTSFDNGYSDTKYKSLDECKLARKPGQSCTPITSGTGSFAVNNGYRITLDEPAIKYPVYVDFNFGSTPTQDTTANSPDTVPTNTADSIDQASAETQGKNVGESCGNGWLTWGCSDKCGGVYTTGEFYQTGKAGSYKQSYCGTAEDLRANNFTNLKGIVKEHVNAAPANSGTTAQPNTGKETTFTTNSTKSALEQCYDMEEANNNTGTCVEGEVDVNGKTTFRYIPATPVSNSGVPTKGLEAGASCAGGSNSSCDSGDCRSIRNESGSRDWYCMKPRTVRDIVNTGGYKNGSGCTPTKPNECESGYCADNLFSNTCEPNPFKKSSAPKDQSLNITPNPGATVPQVAQTGTTPLNTGPLSGNQSGSSSQVSAGQPAAVVPGAVKAQAVPPAVTSNQYIHFNQRKYSNGIDINGCWITTGAMIIANYGTVDKGNASSPEYLNNKYLHLDYIGNGRVEALSQAYEANNIKLTDVSKDRKVMADPLSYVANNSSKNNPIAVAIYCSGCYGGGHWVLAVGKDDKGNPLILDPLKDNQSAPVSLDNENYPNLRIDNGNSIDIQLVTPSYQ